mmetsp:Transcript_14540/g.21224  ORF Transcript_14540/g.21224 Transcript_14540/m.21224 type:complete len:150 (-) Transcript_14540:568-1017(-)
MASPLITHLTPPPSPPLSNMGSKPVAADDLTEAPKSSNSNASAQFGGFVISTTQPVVQQVSVVSPSSSVSSNQYMNSTPVEVMIGYSGDIIDTQTCAVLGLPTGSQWGSNASSVRQEYMQGTNQSRDISYPTPMMRGMPDFIQPPPFAY